LSVAVPDTPYVLDYRAEYDLAIAVAREAGALLREMHGRVRDVRHKGLVDLVTEADRASEALIARRLLEAYPDDRLLAEEGTAASQNLGAERVWIVDPLDGTTNYAHGHPVFAVSIALYAAGHVRAGAVYDPLRDELFAARAGDGATLNDAPLCVSDTEQLIDAMLATGFAYDPVGRMENILYFQRFVELSQAVRREGSAALDLCYVAAGRYDGYWERGIAPWDVAAASLILTEAGGRLSGYASAPFDVFAREIVASNGHLHDAMQDVIRSIIAKTQTGY
jgi:myo-inositol-1(or 4)-monophosphatase